MSPGVVQHYPAARKNLCERGCGAGNLLSDPDDVGETSFRHSGGKYQGRKGATVAKI